MALKTTPQDYPRIANSEHKDFGLLDDSALQEHTNKIAIHKLKEIIKRAIKDANKKSSRAILEITTVDENELEEIYKKKGWQLFEYFKKYCGDPASSAYACLNKHYKEVAAEQFRNWTLQKERMNSGWRYQFIAKDAAIHSKRFDSISDIGAVEADFNAIIKMKKIDKKLSIYVSVKNRTNTMGGQDWPKAIHALENMAKNDRNRMGPYICVFGIAMEKGKRFMKRFEIKLRTPEYGNIEIVIISGHFLKLKYEEIINA